jgi:hypothetical protein
MAATKKVVAKSKRRGGKVSPTKKLVQVPPPPRYTEPLPVRITPDLLDRVDALRPDMVAREPFVRHILDIGLTLLEEEG